MQFTYDDYRLDYPIFKLENFFLPDQVLRPMELALPRMREAVERYDKRVKSGEQASIIREIRDTDGDIRSYHPHVPEPVLDWTQTCCLVLDALQAVHPEIEESFRRAVRNGWIEARADTSGGLTPCLSRPKSTNDTRDQRPATILMVLYRNVYDAINLIHEFGHYFTDDCRGNVDETLARGWFADRPAFVDEIQSFFLQHAFCDEIKSDKRTPEICTAVKLGKSGATICMLRKNLLAFKMLEENWEKDPSRAVYADGKLNPAYGYWLHEHVHGPAYFYAAGLYQRYRTMDATAKNSLVEILYPQGNQYPVSKGSMSISEVFNKLGMDTSSDIVALFEDGFAATVGTLP